MFKVWKRRKNAHWNKNYGKTIMVIKIIYKNNKRILAIVHAYSNLVRNIRKCLTPLPPCKTKSEIPPPLFADIIHERPLRKSIKINNNAILWTPWKTSNILVLLTTKIIQSSYHWTILNTGGFWWKR